MVGMSMLRRLQLTDARTLSAPQTYSSACNKQFIPRACCREQNHVEMFSLSSARGPAAAGCADRLPRRPASQPQKWQCSLHREHRTPVGTPAQVPRRQSSLPIRTLELASPAHASKEDSSGQRCLEKGVRHRRRGAARCRRRQRASRRLPVRPPGCRSCASGGSLADRPRRRPAKANKCHIAYRHKRANV